MWNENKAQGFKGSYGLHGQAAGGGRESAPESLASVTPRVIELAQSVEKISHHLTQSLGIGKPMAEAPQSLSSAPTILSSLLNVEYAIQVALENLQSVNAHING